MYIPSLQILSTQPSIPTDALVQTPSDYINPVPPVTPVSSAQFVEIVDSVKEAIEQGIHPIMITKGSSGSYFCRNPKGRIVGVFKPKDEEPYGHLNPKCTKWIHRNLFPCCFGRDCLIPNLGYISEAAASYMDQRLGLGIVPRTEIVRLSSPTFSYPAADRWAHKYRNKPLPLKTGSFQLFVNGYTDASAFFYQGYERLKSLSSSDLTTSTLVDIESPRSSSSSQPPEWDEHSRRLFRLCFERMVVLDYLVRQTDRGMDNWMIRQKSLKDTLETSLEEEECPKSVSLEPSLSIAAIDNGLAFPYKHPDRFRSYPYGWSFLPLARIAMSPETGHQVLSYLTSPRWWEETIRGLHALFSIDPDFSEQMFSKQLGVIRGQSHNLIEILRRRGSPADLVARPLVTIIEEPEADDGLVSRSRRSFARVRQRIQTLQLKPFFTSC